AYWEPDARYERIRQYLHEQKKLSPEDFQQMQNDTQSLFTRDLTEQILPVLKQQPGRFETVISYLENWDYSYEPSETAASIMDVFLLKLSKNAFEDEMSASSYSRFVRFSALPARTILRFLKDDISFFNDTTTPERETKTEMIIGGMDET